MNIGSGAGAVLAGLDRDLAGNYHASLIANVAMGVAAAAMTLSVKVRPVVATEPAPSSADALAPALGLANRVSGD
jgi:hypothetical protein